MDGFARAGSDGQLAAYGDVCAVTDETDIVVEVEREVEVDRRHGSGLFFLFAQHDDIVVQRGHGGFLRTEHTVITAQRTVEDEASGLVVLHFRAAGEAQAAVWTGEGVVFVEDDIYVNIRIGVGKVDGAF